MRNVSPVQSEEQGLPNADGVSDPSINRRDAWLIGIVALGVFLFAVFEARLPQFSSAQSLMNHLTFFLLINLNVLLLVVFVFLVGRNLVKLTLERRRRILGSHLRWRLVIAFVSLSALRYIPAATLTFLFYTYPAWVTVISASTLWSGTPAGMCRPPLTSDAKRTSVCGFSFANRTPRRVRSVVALPADV